MYNMPRAATIKAVSAGTLWSLDRKTFRQIIVKANAIKRTQFEEFLKSVEILQHINVRQSHSTIKMESLIGNGTSQNSRRYGIKEVPRKGNNY